MNRFSAVCNELDVRWRPMHDDDVVAVAALEAQSHVAPWTTGNFHDALGAGYSAIVGEIDGTIVAYGVLMLAPGEAQILNLTVTPSARRRGLGRTLLRRFIAGATSSGASQCFLEVRVSNTAAIALYAAEDFLPVARRVEYYPATSPDGPREDALVMRRDIVSD